MAVAPVVGSKIPVGRNYTLAELAVDASTASSVPSALLAAPAITTGGGDLLVTFAASFSMAILSGLVNFIVMLDGVAKKSIGIQPAGVALPMASALVARLTGVAAGAHTVEIDWKTSAGTAQIRPVTAADNEQATILVEEVPK